MTIIVQESFDHYPSIEGEGGLSSRWYVNNPANSALVAGRTGGQGLQFTASPSDPYITLDVGGSLSLFALGFAFKYTALPTTDTIYSILWHSTWDNFEMLSLRVHPDGALTLRTRDWSISAPAGAVQEGSWHFLELELNIVSSGGFARLWLDNVLQAERLGAIYYHPDNYMNGLNFGSLSGNAGYGDFILDDVYLTDDGVRLGPSTYKQLRAVSDVSTQFSPLSGSDNFAMIDEVLTDLDASYVSGSNAGDTDLYAFEALGLTPSAIHSVSPISYAKRTDGISRALQLPVKAGATQDDGASLQLAELYSQKHRILELNPDTGLPWTVADIDAVNAGLKVA